MSATEKPKILLTLPVKLESDILMVRRRARQIALLIGYGAGDQTRISTAVSEIARNAYIHAKGGFVDFFIDDRKQPIKLVIITRDKGPGMPDTALSVSDEHMGLRGAKKLVDAMKIDSSPAGTSVTLEKNLINRVIPFSAAEIDELANSLARLAGTNPLDEVYQQNQELLVALDQLSKSQTQLAEMNAEFIDKNRQLESLYAEVRALNNSLEERVARRTAELANARDEAIAAHELKSQFITNISHEIRTPMSGILGLSELLVSETTGQEHETAEFIHKSAKTLMTLVNDLLDMSRLEAGKLELVEEDFRVDSIVDGVFDSFSASAAQKGIVLDKKIDALLDCTVHGAACRIRQVLNNLVHNAIKFSDKGTVKVDATIQNRDGDTAFVRFAVQDQGPGISVENQKRLFNLFVQVDGSMTRRHGGTGLGLALSKRLVELMKGSIGVESREGEGSTFWFSVPMQVKQDAQQ
ncbi:hypothetical protein KF728_20700 [Candidatus Obscuribacterales bacterium]|nr:hypothetical protein [Candidatus Obscuribacterales bacterium]MBX3152589.1 hypothetical protein [Candidatus Obscuribacterales bacterium]